MNQLAMIALFLISFAFGWFGSEQHQQTVLLATIAEQTRTPVSVKLDGFSDDARACIAAQWQPIETAPKDGRPIQVWRPSNTRDDNLFTVLWMDDCWQVDDGKNYHPLRGEYPTYWQPLPEPPAAITAVLSGGT